MDGFESVRDAARRLHDAVVVGGADPFDPAALIAAAVERLKLELVWLPAGDPALKGARALFDEQSGTICCEETDDAAARALLVAHEIGHVEVHAGSPSCTSTDIDPSRSTEVASVGLQRVEDYGARERRELQANVFAREFVLPQRLAAEMHCRQDLTATDIAERTGLPLALVRQQLFDALLLPPASPSVAAPVSNYTPRPDPSQDRAAAHRGSPFLLQAGPGTGKTRTLIKRVGSLLADGIDPAAILILTFSNRAAGELAERLALSEPAAAHRIWIGTFHAFGLDLVRRHHDRFELSPNPPLFDRSDAIEVLEEILPTLPLVHYRNLWDPAMVLRDVVGAISRAKDELTDPVRYRALAAAMLAAATDDEGRQAAEKCLEVAHIYELYEQALRARGAVDFGDLIMRPALLLESDAELRLAAQLRHRHVLVDEYQDVNRASARLLKAVAGNGKRLWVVGDARQSIYRFRGASSANMVRFAEDYPEAVADQLKVNYRSTRQIVDAFVTVAPRMGASTGMLPLALEADRGLGPAVPQIRRYDTLDLEAEGIAASVRELEAVGVGLRDQAVLCRSNVRLNEIAAALEARGIPVLHLGSLFERDEVRDLLALLSLAVDPFGDALVRVGAMKRYDVTLQDVHVATRHLRALGRPALLGLTTLSGAEGLSPEGAAAFARLADDLIHLKPGVSAWDFLSTYVLDRTNLVRKLAAGGSVTKQMSAIAVWQFLNFVREQSPTGSGLPIQRTLDRVRQLVLLAEERDLRQVPASALHLDAVRLMTVHGSKGLEFEAVHVPGLTVQSFPSNNRGQRCPPPVGMIEGAEGLSVSDEARRAHDNEEQCLFFVALSRARTHLRLCLARKQPNGNNRSASPFLSWLPSSLVGEVSSPAILPMPSNAPRPQPISILRGAAWSITDSRLVAYEKCPRRFFYTHVMGLGGARKRTAFTQTHDCLYDFIRWLADARRTADPTIEQVEAAFEVIWREKGPIDHAFCEDYRRLATRLRDALIRAGAGRRFREAEPLAIDFPSGRVIVEPNELAEMPDGTVVIRRVRTGHRRSDEYDRLEYSLYHLAVQGRFGGRVVVQALHLTDETEETVMVSTTKIGNRTTKSDSMLARIAQGWFPPEVDPVTCPRCPHFFICAATPHGSITLS
ncbi:ATP-dependent DNA helicase Rep [Paraburkholderia phenoliruptrix]|uniref:DNA 3'-5' helicase n=1 Tax=Paraburkholderia phenoliruptrix TaxID=252970 RepID=A0A6J5B8N5_9BURK|nr:ATP-dependent helicase [Paraburkholderia phenoliruptrix]CAB3695961.1 ATP-dependent DNA helicase Rep [Paraburkholderia phenoliruptrix]